MEIPQRESCCCKQSHSLQPRALMKDPRPQQPRRVQLRASAAPGRPRDPASQPSTDIRWDGSPRRQDRVCLQAHVEGRQEGRPRCTESSWEAMAPAAQGARGEDSGAPVRRYSRPRQQAEEHRGHRRTARRAETFRATQAQAESWEKRWGEEVEGGERPWGKVEPAAPLRSTVHNRTVTWDEATAETEGSGEGLEPHPGLELPTSPPSHQ